MSYERPFLGESQREIKSGLFSLFLWFLFFLTLLIGSALF